MRRFEVYGAKPPRVWSVGVEGTRVVSSDGEQVFASAAAAMAGAEAMIAERRAQGFIEIKRVTAYVNEEPVKRKKRIVWVDGYVKRFVDLFQEDRLATRTTGRFDSRGNELDKVPEQKRFVQIAEASAHYDAWLVEANATKASAKDGPALGVRGTAAEPALEAACRRARDAAPWAVYADWLIANGDPLGELAGLALGGKTQDAEGALAQWFPELRSVRVGLFHGFPRQLSVPGQLQPCAEVAPRLAAVLASPACRFVDELSIEAWSHHPDQHDWAPVLDVLVAARPNLRVLVLDGDHKSQELDYDHPEGEAVVRAFPPLGPYWSHFTALERLVIDRGAGGHFDRFELPALRTFVRRTAGMRTFELAAVLSATWPALSSLELWLGAHRGISVANLAPLLQGPFAGHLGLVNSELADELVAALAKSRVLPRLYSLDLSDGTMSDDGANAFVRHATKFRHLASIELENNYLSDEAVEQIRAVLDNVVIDHQRITADERYVGTGE